MAAKPRGLPGQLHPNYIPSLAKMKTTFILRSQCGIARR